MTLTSQPRPILDRALEIAGTGLVRRIEEIRRQLVREDYDDVDAHLAGAWIREQLRTAVARARAAGSIQEDRKCAPAVARSHSRQAISRPEPATTDPV